MPGKVVSQEEWLKARKELLVREKAHTRATRELAASLSELPMVKVEKDYAFTAEDGSTASLSDLFKGRKQLIIYHFMFGPDAKDTCKGCTMMADHLPHQRHLNTKSTSLAVVSRGPIDKLLAVKAKTDWKFPWYSSLGSDFNYDFHATLDEAVRAPVEYNYLTKEELLARGLQYNVSGEQPGMSVFWKDADGVVFHTYSAYSVGLDKLIATFTLLDMTPLGRQTGPTGPAEFKRSYEDEKVE